MDIERSSNLYPYKRKKTYKRKGTQPIDRLQLKSKANVGATRQIIRSPQGPDSDTSSNSDMEVIHEHSKPQQAMMEDSRKGDEESVNKAQDSTLDSLFSGGQDPQNDREELSEAQKQTVRTVIDNLRHSTSKMQEDAVESSSTGNSLF